MDNSIFPHIRKAVEDFMYDQEGNIPRNKILTVGSMLLILGILLTDDAFADHRSHSSHSSHSSHRSHSSGSGGHSSHSSHISHSSHVSSSYSSHSSHSNAAHSNAPAHASHSNAAPSLSTLNGIKAPDALDVVDMASALGLVESVSDLPETTPIEVSIGAVEDTDVTTNANANVPSEEN